MSHIHNLIRTLLLTACVRTAQAQPASGVRVSASRNVLADVSDWAAHPLIEPHLAAHPTNARHLLAAVTVVGNSKEPFGLEQRCATLLSLDGGSTWVRHEFPVEGCGDPWVAITPAGEALFVAMSMRPYPSGSEKRSTELVVFRSADGGRTWAESPWRLDWRHDHGGGCGARPRNNSTLPDADGRPEAPGDARGRDPGRGPTTADSAIRR